MLSNRNAFVEDAVELLLREFMRANVVALQMTGRRGRHVKEGVGGDTGIEIDARDVVNEKRIFRER